MKISLNLIIKSILDDTTAKAQQAELKRKNEVISKGIDENEAKQKEVFIKSLEAMRASYQIIGGITQAMGGGMSEAFSAMYSLAVSSIAVFSAIAAAQFFVPGMQLQSLLMVASLVAAIAQVVSVATGLTKITSTVNGINRTLHGIGSMISSFSL